jgi:hypothetical protein
MTGTISKDELLHTFKMMGITVSVLEFEALKELLPDSAVYFAHPKARLSRAGRDRDRDNRDNSDKSEELVQYREIQHLLQHYTVQSSNYSAGAGIDMGKYNMLHPHSGRGYHGIHSGIHSGDNHLLNDSYSFDIGATPPISMRKGLYAHQLEGHLPSSRFANHSTRSTPRLDGNDHYTFIYTYIYKEKGIAIMFFDYHNA